MQKLPNDINGKDMPFVILGDEAFALSEHVLRPYPIRNLSIPQRVYNYRLSRARRMVECSFGILTSKWRILNRALDLNPDNIVAVTKACTILHNYVRVKDGFQFEATLYNCTLENITPIGVRSNQRGISVRDYFTNYFTSTQGSVPWQYKMIQRGH